MCAVHFLPEVQFAIVVEVLYYTKLFVNIMQYKSFSECDSKNYLEFEWNLVLSFIIIILLEAVL